MRRFIFGTVLFAILVCLVGACAVVSGSRDSDKSLREPSLYIMVASGQTIPSSGSYSWGPHYFRLPSDKMVDLAEIDERLSLAINEELAQRGYNEVEDNSELIVSFAAGLNAELDEILLNEAYGEEFKFSFPMEEIGGNRVYNRGSLIIDMLDGKTRKLLWRGIISAAIETDIPEKAEKERAGKAVRLLLDQFPKPKTAE